MRKPTTARLIDLAGAFHVPGHRDQRRAFCRFAPSGRCSTCSPASITKRRWRRPAKAGAQRRAVSEAARRDGAAVRRSARGAGGQRHACPSGCDTRWPISDTAFRNIRCRREKPHISFLRKLADLGARERYRPYHDRARAQIARELDLIERLDLAGYFLIVWDIVNFCRHHGILVQGRGSAANSAVCYSLGITAVDPVGMELLFERFLSEERGEWPDIDLDLPSGDRRERVIQHVYEKYGRLGAAMTANVITYRGRSAAREVGKTLGIDPGQVDRLAKVMNQFEFVDPADTLGESMVDAGCDADHPTFRLFADLWRGCRICRGISDSIRAAW